MTKLLPSILFLVAISIRAYCCTSTITISATTPASDSVCAEDSILYTAVIVPNGGTGATYQWQVNGVNVGGATKTTFTYAPAPGDVVTCKLHNSCGNVTSNSLSPIVKPALNQVPAQIFCGGDATSPVSLYGASWTNSNTAIGLAASGTGDIPSFVAINNSTTPVTAIIAAIQTCSTTDTAIFSIIINPIPTVDTVNNQIICAGSTTTAINFTGPEPYTVFNWTGSNTAIGLASSGADSIPSFAGINSGSTPVIDTITVTPYTSGYAYMTDAINGYAYAVSRAYDTLIASINLQNGFFNFGIGITVSSDGNSVYIANNGANTVSVISTLNDSLVNTINVGNEPWGIVISPNGKFVYVANSGDGTIQVISTVTDTVVLTIPLPEGPTANPEGIAISPDGSRLYVTGSTDTGKVYFINTATNLVFDSVLVDSLPSGVIVSPDGAKVYVANNVSRNISTITVSTKNVTTSAVFTSTVSGQIENNGLALSPDGLTLYVSSFWDGTVVYYNTSTNPPKLLGTIPLPGGSGEAPVGLSMSSDGQYLYVSNAGDGYFASNYSSLEVINTATETVVSSDVIVNPGGEEISYSFGNFVTGVSCTGTPYTFTITVNPTGGTPSANLGITSGSLSVCQGAPDTFTVTATNFATVSNYNFEVNGTSVQSGTSATYETDSINNNDTVTCIVTGSDCLGPASFASNNLIMTVTSVPGVVPSVTATPNTYHPGDDVVIVATPPTPDLPGTMYKFIEAFPESGGFFVQVQDTTNDTLILNDVTAYGTSIKSPGVTWLFVYANDACGEATGAFYQISVIPPTTSSNPTVCGDTDGYIAFPGLIPDNEYTVNYDMNAIAQPQLTLTTGASGLLTIPDLGAGTYSNIILQVLNQGSSSLSAPADPVTLIDPCGGITAYPVTYNNGISTAGKAVNVCAGIANIGLANADSGVTYNLYQGIALVATETRSSGGAFNFSYTPLAGYTYLITGTVLPDTTAMNGSVTVYANPTVIISDTGLTGCANPGITLGTTGSSAGSGSISTYQWNNNSGNIIGATGGTYTATATDNYTVIVTNSNSCSDTSPAISVNVLPLATSFISQSICSGQSFDGYMEPGTYIDTFNAFNGCDSIRTLYLSVLQTVSDTIDRTICAGQSFEGHDSTGIFIDTLLAIGGCDSVIRTLNLSTITPVVNTAKQVICQGDTFEGYTTSGYYSDTILATGGCDSIIQHLELEVFPLSTVPVITQIGDTLFSSPAKSYTWYENSTLLTDTSSTLIISQSGQYNVVVTDSNGSCPATSTTFNAVINGISAITETPLITIYPDPANDVLNVQISNLSTNNDVVVCLYDAIGKLVLLRRSSSTPVYSDQFYIGDLAGGLYFLNIQQGNWIINKKVVIAR